jgi:hypothetical protein
MDGRGWWTVVLTALAGPLGAFGAGLGLARWAEMTTGGMAVLAGAIVGLLLGAPLAAFIVFVVCLVTLMRSVPLRRWIASLIMLGVAVVEAMVMLVGLRLVGGMANPQLGLIGTALAVTLVLGLGAYVALVASRRASVAAPVPDAAD